MRICKDCKNYDTCQLEFRNIPDEFIFIPEPDRCNSFVLSDEVKKYVFENAYEKIILKSEK